MPRRIGVGEAILGGSAMIAVATFLGLRSRAPQAPQGASAEPQGTAAAIAPVDRVTATRAALESQRALFVSRCWSPSAAVRAEPATSTYAFEIAIDATGHERGRGITDLRDARSDVGNCLRALREPVQVAPPVLPGVSRIEMTLP